MSDDREISAAGRFLPAALMLFAVIVSAAMADEGEEGLPDVSEHVSVDRLNYLYISDIAPVVRRVLKAPRPARLINEMSGGPVGKSKTTALTEFDETIAGFVPDQIFLGMSDEGVAGLSRLMSLVMRFALCDSAVQSGEQDSLEEIHQGLIKNLRDVRIAEIDLWLRFRSEEIAMQLESQVRAVVGTLADEGQLKADFNPQGMNIHVKVGDFLPARLINGVLFSINMTDDLSDPDLQVAADIIAEMSLDIAIDRIGTALLIQLGKSDKAPDERLDTRSGKLWTENAEMLVYARYNTAAFRAQVTATQDLWKRYRDTPLGRTLMEADTEDLLGTLADVAESLGPEDVTGEMRVLANEKLTIDVQETGAVATQSLAESEVLSFIPKSASAWLVSSESSLGDMIRRGLSSFEDRLATTTARSEFSDEESKAEMAEQINEFYYNNLREFRRLIREDTRSVFAAPVAIVVGDQMQNETFTFRFEHDGDANLITASNVPVVPLAVVTKLSPEANLGEFLSRVQTAFAGAWKDVPNLQLTVASRLDGIEGPVQILSSEWHPQVLPHGLRVQAEGPGLLHGLIAGDHWLILSTSPDLTRSILAASKSPSERKPFSDEQGRHVLSVSGTGATINDTVLLPLHWIGLLVENNGLLNSKGAFARGMVAGFEDGEAFPRDLSRFIGLMREMVAVIDEIKMDATIQEGLRVFQCTVTFLD